MPDCIHRTPHSLCAKLSICVEPVPNPIPVRPTCQAQTFAEFIVGFCARYQQGRLEMTI